jgi:serine/threonine protein kinase
MLCRWVYQTLIKYNILISPSTRAYIADFGLATLSESGSATTVAGSAIMGTPRWLAPELIPRRGVKRHHTNVTDIYAFALVCYEASYTPLRP